MVIRLIPVHDIVKTALFFPPELPAERCFYKFRKRGVVVRGHNMTVQPRGSTSNRNFTAGTRGRTASNQNIVSLIPPGKFLHDLQRIIPERIDLHRFSVARGGNPVTDTHVHPGDLVKTASGMDETVLLHINTEICAVFVSGNDFLQMRINIFLYKRIGSGIRIILQILPYRIKIPQGSVRCIIKRSGIVIREHVWHDPVTDVFGKS